MQNVRTSSSKEGRYWWGIHGIVNTNCTPFAAVRDKQIALMFNDRGPQALWRIAIGVVATIRSAVANSLVPNSTIKPIPGLTNCRPSQNPIEAPEESGLEANFLHNHLSLPFLGHLGRGVMPARAAWIESWLLGSCGDICSGPRIGSRRLVSDPSILVSTIVAWLVFDCSFEHTN